MSPEYLNGKLECPSCGTIPLDIPEDAVDDTPIKCAQCQGGLGTWGELQGEFIRQLREGVFDLNHGRLRRMTLTVALLLTGEGRLRMNSFTFLTGSLT